MISEQPPPRAIPRTIENTREVDETVCKPDDEEVLKFSSDLVILSQFRFFLLYIHCYCFLMIAAFCGE